MPDITLHVESTLTLRLDYGHYHKKIIMIGCDYYWVAGERRVAVVGAPFHKTWRWWYRSLDWISLFVALVHVQWTTELMQWEMELEVKVSKFK